MPSKRGDGGEELDSERWAARYRCCCGCCHLKKASAATGFIDLVLLSGIFGRGLQLYMNVKSSPASISWLTASALLLFLGFASIFALWWGIWRESSLFFLPKLVMKVFTLFGLLLLIFLLSYLVYIGSHSIVVLVAHELHLGYYAARQALKIGGTILVLLISCLGVMEFWFLVVLYDCYRYVRKRELLAATADLLRSADLPDPPQLCVTTPSGRHTVRTSESRTPLVLLSPDHPPSLHHSLNESSNNHKRRSVSIPVPTPEIRTANGSIPIKVQRPRSVLEERMRSGGLECTCPVNPLPPKELLVLSPGRQKPIRFPVIISDDQCNSLV